jgi:hypothetical protein
MVMPTCTQLGPAPALEPSLGEQVGESFGDEPLDESDEPLDKFLSIAIVLAVSASSAASNMKRAACGLRLRVLPTRTSDGLPDTPHLSSPSGNSGVDSAICICSDVNGAQPSSRFVRLEDPHGSIRFERSRLMTNSCTM